MLLAGEEAGVGRLVVLRERERERDLHARAVGALALALEIEHVEIADVGGTERRRVGRRALALEHQHREAFVAREKRLRERAERDRARLRGRNQRRLADAQQFDEHAGKLHDAVMRAPRMAVARADREAEPRISLARRVEVVHRMHDMVETARHDALPGHRHAPSWLQACAIGSNTAGFFLTVADHAGIVNVGSRLSTRSAADRASSMRPSRTSASVSRTCGTLNEGLASTARAAALSASSKRPA